MTKTATIYVDRRALMQEWGFRECDADRIMQRVATSSGAVRIEGSRKTYLRREDVEAFLEERTR